MKNSVLCTLLLMLMVQLFAQGKKEKSLLIGVQFGAGKISTQKISNIPSLKLGIPSFSYAASIEKRFTLHNKLNFSFQYSLNYVRPVDIQSITKNSSLQHGVSLSKVQTVYDNTRFLTGIGINTPFFTNQNSSLTGACFPEVKRNYQPHFNPYFLIGLENSTKLFKRNLIYSMQYNLGFMPLLKPTPTTEGPATQSPDNAGFRIGLKYKY